METIQPRIADATARLSLVTSSRRYPDRQIRGAYTPTSTKPGDGDPGCLLLCDGSILCKPPPSPALPSPRASRASSVFCPYRRCFRSTPSILPLTYPSSPTIVPFSHPLYFLPLRRPPLPLPPPSPPAVSTFPPLPPPPLLPSVASSIGVPVD